METKCLQIFGQRLKELREERGISQRELAEIIGISKGAVYYYESDGRAPDIVTLEKLCDYFEVSADYLLGRTNARTPKLKLKSVCEKVGLSDKSVLMLARLKKDKCSRLRIINLLLEQAADDIEDDYEFDGIFEGSVLNAVCRYLDGSTDIYLSEEFEDYATDPRRYARIRLAVRKLIFDQVLEAVKIFEVS